MWPCEAAQGVPKMTCDGFHDCGSPPPARPAATKLPSQQVSHRRRCPSPTARGADALVCQPGSDRT